MKRSKRAAARLDGDTFARLRALAARTGKTTACHIREAVEEHLEDLEDLHTVERAALKHRRSGAHALSLPWADGSAWKVEVTQRAVGVRLGTLSTTPAATLAPPPLAGEEARRRIPIPCHRIESLG